MEIIKRMRTDILSTQPDGPALKGVGVWVGGPQTTLQIAWSHGTYIFIQLKQVFKPLSQVSSMYHGFLFKVEKNRRRSCGYYRWKANASVYWNY